MYIVLGMMLVLLLIVTIIYHKNRIKITKELEKIEKENGVSYKSKKKKYK